MASYDAPRSPASPNPRFLNAALQEPSRRTRARSPSFRWQKLTRARPRPSPETAAPPPSQATEVPLPTARPSLGGWSDGHNTHGRARPRGRSRSQKWSGCARHNGRQRPDSPSWSGGACCRTGGATSSRIAAAAPQSPSHVEPLLRERGVSVAQAQRTAAPPCCQPALRPALRAVPRAARGGQAHLRSP